MPQENCDIRHPDMNMDLLSCWSNADYWRKLCPHLSISDSDVTTSTANETEGDSNEQTEKCELQQRLINDGYALIDSQCDNATRDTVAQAISDLETRHSLPATFALLYDETWHLAFESQRLLLRGNSVLHPSMLFNFDMLAWHIDPQKNQVGFSPHRDRQPDTDEALKGSFYSDGQAKYVTHWIALTDANPNNSCLYVIPKQFDPGYSEGDDPQEDTTINNNADSTTKNDNDEISDPLTRALPTKQSYQNIRALPRPPGQSIIFTHRILHWGSAGNPNYKKAHPRIALSFVYSDPEFEAPYLTNYTLDQRLPPLSLRLLLVCSQLLIYYQRLDLSTQYLRTCYEYVKLHEKELNEVYRKKVFVEFVKAMKERRDGVGDGDQCVSKGNTGDGSSEDEDAMLEAMLENEEEFEDDFDDLEYDDYEKNSKRPRIR